MNTTVRICFFSSPSMLKKDSGPSFLWWPELLHRRLQVKSVSSAMLQICCPTSLEISHCQRFAAHLTAGNGRVNAYLRDLLVLPVYQLRCTSANAHSVYPPCRASLCMATAAWAEVTQQWVVTLLGFLLHAKLLFSVFPSLIRDRAQSCEAVWQWQRCERGKRGRRLNHCLVLLPSGCLPAPRRAHTHLNLCDMSIPGQAMRYNMICNQGSLNEWVISNCICASANRGGNQAIVF